MDDRSARELNKYLGAQFDLRDKRLKAAEQGLANLSRHVSQMQQPARSDDSLKSFRDHETHYANVILLLGYGGFFALWASTAGKMPALWFGLSGVLIVVSLLLFICYELWKTAAISHSMTNSMRKGLSANETIDRMNSAVERVNGAWPFVFYPTVVTGLVSGLIVLGCFASNVYIGAYGKKVDTIAAPVASPARVQDSAQRGTKPQKPQPTPTKPAQ